MFNRILIPIDGSAYSKKALEFGCEFANKYDASITILHVTYDSSHNQTMVLGSAAVTYQVDQNDLDQTGRAIIDAGSELAAEMGCSSVQTRMKSGLPAKEIVEYAKKKDFDMIIMGSRGLTDIAGLIMGSVSHKVNHLAECTCVTVR